MMQALFKSLLYPKKYENPYWMPGDPVGEERHVEAFCEFLATEVVHQALSKDLYTSFKRFNFEMDPSCEAWKEEESACKLSQCGDKFGRGDERMLMMLTGPTTIDEYILWKRKKVDANA